MAENQFIIEFKPSNQGELIEAFNAVKKAQNGLVKTTGKAKKATKESADAIKLNQIEFQKFARTLDLSKQSINKLGLSLETLEKAEEGNAKALGLVRRAYNMEKQAVMESLTVAKQKEVQSQKNKIAEEKLAEAARKSAVAQRKLKDNLAIQATEINNNKVKVKNLNKSLKQANMTFKDAGVNLKTVKLALQGNTRALAAMTQATKLATANTKRLKSGLFSITNEGRLLSNTFATARSKLLLYSFGASIVSKVLVDQVKAFAKQEESVQRLADVFGDAGAKRLDEYSSELQRNSTFGDENINVVMAQIGAFGANEEQTKKLTQATADLAAGMKIDLNTAGLLVAKTIGSGTNALSRYGILLDMTGSKSNKVAGLTESVQEKFGGLAEELANTTEGQLAQAQNAFGDAAEVIGEFLAPSILFAANVFKKFAESLSVEKIYSLLTAVGALGVGVAIYKRQAILATLATIKLNAAMKRNLFGFAAAAVVLLLTKLIELTGIFKDNTEELSDNAKKLSENGEEIGKYIKKVDNVTKSMEKKLALLKANTEIEKFAIENGIDLVDVNRELFFEIEKINKELKEEKKLQDLIKKSYESHIDTKLEAVQANIAMLMAEQALVGNSKELERALEVQLKAEQDILDKRKEKAKATTLSILSEFGLFDTISEIANREMELHRQVADSKIENINREEQRELEALRNTFAFKKSTDAQKEKLEQEIIKKHDKREKDAKAIADRRMLASFRAQQGVSIANVVMSTAEAIAKATAISPLTGGLPWSKLAKAIGAAQIGLILAQSPPKMEYGGLIGGKPHSQGGTMIEAERGEFVVRKSAVDSIGLETLNRINSGMGSGSVNISFQGNVLSKDFIEDEAIPMIRDAIRRGEDIGLS